jgi:hypothetical protein
VSTTEQHTEPQKQGLGSKSKNLVKDKGKKTGTKRNPYQLLYWKKTQNLS